MARNIVLVVREIFLFLFRSVFNLREAAKTFALQWKQQTH